MRPTPRLPFFLRSPLSLGLALLAATVAGCTPTCEQSCRKVLFDCDLDSERVALEECEQNCTRQDLLYEAWDNNELMELAKDHRSCIARSSCEELDQGVCYEGYEELFVFDEGAR